MSQTPTRPTTATLFAQVFGLVLVSLVAAQAVNVWVVLALPRPLPEFYTASQLTVALQRGPTAGQAPSRGLRPLIVNLQAAPPPVDTFDRGRFTRLRQRLSHALGTTEDQIVVSTDFGRGAPDGAAARDVRLRMDKDGLPRDESFIIAPFKVALHRPDGRWLVATSHAPPFPSRWQIMVMIWFLITAVAMTPAAYLFARRLSASVAVFSKAAERLGRDPNAPPLELSGPSEIAPAIAAFNQMQDRLRRYVVDRTAMVAAMAHDLRTPLTRLRFRIESAPDALKAKMGHDLDEMEAMISQALAFVRDSRGEAERSPLELSSLLESVVDDMAETGADVAVEGAERVIVQGEPMALRRLLTNLIENALKFGGRARGRLTTEDGFAVIEIDDEGPGVPPEENEKVFEPFYRREPSRSRQTGGSGLGLAVVRSIARAHGGDATLENRLAGGLTARVRLPIPVA